MRHILYVHRFGQFWGSKILNFNIFFLFFFYFFFIFFLGGGGQKNEYFGGHGNICEHFCGVTYKLDY